MHLTGEHDISPNPPTHTPQHSSDAAFSRKLWLLKKDRAPTKTKKTKRASRA